MFGMTFQRITEKLVAIDSEYVSGYRYLEMMMNKKNATLFYNFKILTPVSVFVVICCFVA